MISTYDYSYFGKWPSIECIRALLPDPIFPIIKTSSPLLIFISISDNLNDTSYVLLSELFFSFLN